jgi:hypothetical protein
LDQSVRKPFGQFDDRAPIGWAPDFSERNDEPQTLNGTWIDVVILQQLPQFFIEIGEWSVLTMKTPEARHT